MAASDEDMAEPDEREEGAGGHEQEYGRAQVREREALMWTELI